MNQSLSLQMNGLPEKKENTDMENCRFLHGLNNNCQLEVLQYLGVNDLLQVSRLCTYFEELITKWIIGNRLLNLEVKDACGTPEILKAFGKSIRKIRATGNDYNVILDTLIKYCSPNLITDIQIVVNAVSAHNAKVVRSLPPFTNLQKLRLDNKFGSRNMVGHLKEFAVGAPNLKVLKVRGYNIQGGWLRTKHMKNLCEIWMHTSRSMSMDDLAYFFSKHPKLQVFSFTGVNDIVAIGNCLSEYCKNLEKFCYEDISEDGDDKLYQFGDGANNDAANRYRFLSSFPNLNVVTLTSLKYVNYPLVSLTSRYTVKELKININLSSFTNQCKFKHAIDLQTVEIDIRKSSDVLEKREPCDTTLQCIVDIVTQMKNLETITLCSGKKVSNLHKILELVPNIRTFSISNVDFLHLPVEIRKIARMLRKVRQERNHQIHLIVNAAQLRELEIYENENIMSTAVEVLHPRKRYRML